MVFILPFVNMVYHIDCFVYTEESLHPWDKSHLIMVYDPFNVLLDSVCYYFVENDVSCGLVVCMAFIMLRCAPFVPTLLRAFIIKGR